MCLYAYHWFSAMILMANTKETLGKGRINGILHDKARIVYDSYMRWLCKKKKHQLRWVFSKWDKRERERESETAAEKTIAKKRLNIFSPLSLNVVFQYLFIFFKLGCLCMCVYIEMYACGLCAMTVDDFCIACTEFRSFRCELVSEYNAVAVRTLNGHNHHLWCMGTKSCFYCDSFGGRMENCT